MHISYSELKVWAECPFKHKLMYIDKIKGFIGNEYTAFGGAIHSLCENAIVDKFNIHPNNFAISRAIVGDKSDNLEGVKQVGLKTVAKEFSFLSESLCTSPDPSNFPYNVPYCLFFHNNIHQKQIHPLLFLHT